MHFPIAFIAQITPKTLALVVYFVAVFALVGLMLGASYVLGGRDHGRAKDEPFESGAGLRSPWAARNSRCRRSSI